MYFPCKFILFLAVALGITTGTYAQNLAPPPSGLLILDLAGTPIISDYTHYSASFVATTANSSVTFVFRHDPGYFGFDDVSVVDITTPSGNLLQNPNFSEGAPTVSGGGVPGWTYFEQTGLVDVGLPVLGFEAASGTDGLSAYNGGDYFWDDGATGGYDGIDSERAGLAIQAEKTSNNQS